MSQNWSVGSNYSAIYEGEYSIHFQEFYFIFCCESVSLTCLGVDLGPARAAANPGPDPSASPSQDREVNLAVGVRATSRDQRPIKNHF